MGYDIIKKYQGKINVWISEPDKGLYDAMNKGISVATGDIIGILNSDDVFVSEDVLEKVVNFHMGHKIDASIGNIVQCDDNGRIVRLYGSKNWKESKLLKGIMPPHPSIFIKRELFSRYGNYNLDFKIGADYELITRYFLVKRILWKYSGVTTTSMLVGGKSSSGLSSYRIITEEIHKSLLMNNVKHSSTMIRLRFFWKIGNIFCALVSNSNYKRLKLKPPNIKKAL